jgi:two-component system, sporulation sensor kinase A
MENSIVRAFEFAPVGMAVLHPDGTIRHANKALWRLCGYKDDDWKSGIDFEELLHPSDWDGYRRAAAICSDSPSPVRVIVRFVCRDGRTTAEAELSVHLVRNDRHEPSYMLVFAKNRELRETVRNQQGFMFKIKEIGGQFIHTLCDGELLYRMGLTPEQVIGKTLYEFQAPEKARIKESYYRRAWAGEDVTYEGQGGGLWYLASLRPIRKDGIVQEVIASCVDITERKNAERELMEAKEQFESLFNSSPVAIDLVDQEGKVIRVNPAHEALYGWTNEELAGRRLPIYPEDQSEEHRQLTDRLSNGQPVVDFVTKRVGKDGRALTVCVTIACLRDKEGRIWGYTGMTRDITESKKTEELLQRADKLNVVGHLAAGLAHEIRNPLTSLRGFLQLLRPTHREKDKYYDLMLSELDRINTILSELLIIAKPQVTKFEQKNIVQMLMDVMVLMEPQSLLQNIEYRALFEVRELSVYCSETELKQVFINIIKNGMEAMPEGGILTVELIVTWNQEVIVRVSDQGVGIPENRLHRLGEPFYTSKEKGTGLGLMMCYKIIEAHNGMIEIRSRENEGTTVDVLLPVYQAIN